MAGDPTSSQAAAQLPTYNVYSIDGDVTAPLVYVNYGVPADYEGSNGSAWTSSGRIVIARYGASWRGIKPKVAAEHGAVGCLIYSDPRDDGYFDGDVYPKGPYRPPQGVQRGSVSDGPLYAGDPLTPGVGATRPARELRPEDAKTLTKIPVLPISYADAQPLLAALGGPVAPREWRGALPDHLPRRPRPGEGCTSRSPSTGRSRPSATSSRGSRDRFPRRMGASEGNHYDAWVNGSSDPRERHGGAPRGGARPRSPPARRGGGRGGRSCSAPGTAKSRDSSARRSGRRRTRRSSESKAVAYINSDSCGRGFLNVHGSHSLEDARQRGGRRGRGPGKEDPGRAAGFGCAGSRRRRTPEDRRETRERANLRIDALGLRLRLHDVRRSPGDRVA